MMGVSVALFGELVELLRDSVGEVVFLDPEVRRVVRVGVGYDCLLVLCDGGEKFGVEVSLFDRLKPYGLRKFFEFADPLFFELVVAEVCRAVSSRVKGGGGFPAWKA